MSKVANMLNMVQILKDGKELHQFMGNHEGKLAKEILGQDTKRKWSDLWYIYIPYNSEKTLAQMTDKEREERDKQKETGERISESIDSMREFAKWYKERTYNN